MPEPEHPKSPARPKVQIAKLPVTGEDLFGRAKELKIIDDAWENPNTTILTQAALGGVGKTSLVNHWLNRMGRDNFRGASRVYGWSFYSQGAKEGTLLARAHMHRLTHDFAKAHVDLEEVRDLAERSEMKLFLADYHLESARLARDRLAKEGDPALQTELETHVRPSPEIDRGDRVWSAEGGVGGELAELVPRLRLGMRIKRLRLDCSI